MVSHYSSCCCSQLMSFDLVIFGVHLVNDPLNDSLSVWKIDSSGSSNWCTYLWKKIFCMFSTWQHFLIFIGKHCVFIIEMNFLGSSDMIILKGWNKCQKQPSIGILKKNVLKICSKFTEHRCQKVISMKLQSMVLRKLTFLPKNGFLIKKTCKQLRSASALKVAYIFKIFGAQICLMFA